MMKMKLTRSILLPLVGPALIAQVAAVTNPDPADLPKLTDGHDLQGKVSSQIYVHKQVDWLRSRKGGFFSPKIMYRNVDDGISGMFAKAPIAKGEKILHLPVELLIIPTNKNNMCDTAQTLAEEYRKGEKSNWEPYVSYCFKSFNHEGLPANWSDEALALYYDIVGDELSSQNLGDRGSYEDECENDDDDDDDDDEEEDGILEAAYRIVVGRGWAATLLPVFDMFNHRNGKRYNADKVGSVRTGEDISLVASRDIQEGEQIYLSYNECPNTDCLNDAHRFTMPQILAESGFVEEYPRRFNVASDSNRPVFELDEDEEGFVELTWLNGKPTNEDLEWFNDQFERLIDLKEAVDKRLTVLESHEQHTINAFYEAMLEALHFASNGNQDEYKALEDHIHVLLDGPPKVCQGRYKVPGHQVTSRTEAFESVYQDTEFKYFNDDDGNEVNVCLYLDTWLHMCSSLRPHYHEWFVHYPAQFLKQVKRVLFLGGGDNMILHEVLKYPDLEIVIGMELDQAVVRGSFKHFKIQPHYDDNRVEWWFGDAAKSLRMLPDEYLGTFDLVIVDLLTLVTESLMVTDKLTILDFSMLLLNEGGILTMNEDYIDPTKAINAQYTVDLEITDVPIFCQQSINMLSNTVDFMTTEPIDHGVESIVVKPGATKSDKQKFISWWNYHRNVHHKMKERKAETVDASNNTQGVMIVLEAEDSSVSMDSLTGVNGTTIGESLKKVGLTVLSSSSFDKKACTIILKEGYVTLRSWPEHKYFACDLVLWSSLDRLDAAKAALVAAVDAKSTSSYNIVTGGMRGIEAIEVPEYPAENNYTSPNSFSDDLEATAFKVNDLDAILQESTALVQSSNPVFIVFCHERKKSCQSLKVLNDTEISKSGKVIPVWACASGDSMQREVECEKATLGVMKSVISEGKINMIVIDPEAPRKMGQVLKNILSFSSTHRVLMAEQYVVLTPTLEYSGTWRSSLLEWFRTDAATLYTENHAEVLFYSSTYSGKLRMGIFSSGDEDFYPHLVEVIEKCESKTRLVTEIPSVQGGKTKYMADFDPPIVANESSYDKSAAYSQWLAQNPLGMQTVIQLETKIPQAPLSVGEKVLANYEVHSLTGKWYPGTVKSINKDGTFDVDYDNGFTEKRIARHRIRKWEILPDASELGAVLVEHPDHGDWYAGTVLEKMSNNTCRVRIHDPIGSIEIINVQDTIKRFEEPETLPPSEVSSSVVKEMLQKAVASIDPIVETKVEIHEGPWDGCVATVLWSQGNAIAIWDGGHHIDLNLFTYEEETRMHKKFFEKFIETASSFTVLLQNEQPRGSGRVVNFKREMKSNA